MIYSANITPDVDTGIGAWTADGFWKAMHQGVEPDGTQLYPAFPYPWYTKVTREDSDAIFAFLQTLEPVRHQVRRDDLPFPLNIRAAVAGWNLLFFRPGTFQPNPDRSGEWNRGACLVEGLGHCGTCHTPMNALGGSETGQAYAGNALQGWFAPNITANDYQGIGQWGVDDIVLYLKTGATGWSRASGPMAEVVEYSTSLMDEADLHAIATYLKDLPPRGPAAAAQPIAAEEPRMQRGEAIYVDNCAACHRRDGQGAGGMLPALAGDQVVVQPRVDTLARIILAGVRSVATAAEPTAPGMPAFDWKLSDPQAADLITYIRNARGNAAPPATPDDVRRMRRRVNAAAD
jgi:mono/diheme cytochrome c family protein